MADKTLQESFNSEILKNLQRFKIDPKSGKIDGHKADFNKDQHDAETRKSLATNFLHFFFGTLIIFFALSLIYNGVLHDVFNQQNSIMKPLDIANLLGIIATTFSTGMGFIFGYYFKGNH